VVELGSNDGYLLQAFVERGIPALGIEPRQKRCGGRRRARRPDDGDVLRRGHPSATCRQDRRADRVVANNVLAQVPDLNDFVAG
jgi:hypothetical protein